MLALKYRPTRFKDIVGQKHISTVLYRIVVRALNEDDFRLPSAFIFAGGHGRGKTTTARILGAALNCESRTGEPCGECRTCKAVFNAQSSIVLEINSAVQGQVEHIRNLLQQLRYASSGVHQVVILDECHSITAAGFNALLKALEEGVDNTTFVLVTTDPQKIPITIQSRSMPFEFVPIKPEDVTSRLEYVLRSEGIRFDQFVLREIVRESRGALRDAIVLCDQLNSGFGEVTIDGFRQLFGTDTDVLFGELVNAMVDFDVEAMDIAIDNLVGRLSDVGRIIVRWIDFEFSLLKGDAKNLLTYPQDETEILKRIELLWFLSDKVRAYGFGGRQFLRLAVVFMSARMTGRILSEEEAFALLIN